MSGTTGKRTLNRLSLLVLTISGIVGSGWLLGPYHAAQVAGPASILSWPIGGAIVLCIALTFVYLAEALPISGGTVRFLRLAYGQFVGFTFSWIAWIAWIAVAPIETLAIIEYAGNYLPELVIQQEGSLVLSRYGMGAATVLMVGIFCVNALGTAALGHTSNWIIIFKLSVPAATIAVLFCLDFHPENFHARGGFAPLGIAGVLTALPTAGVVYSFMGFNPAIQLASQVKNPGKTIRFAVVWSILTCVLLYTLVQVAFIGALPEGSFEGGWRALSFAGDAGPFAGLVTVLGIAWFAKLLYADALISPFGTAMVQSAATGWLTYGMATNGYLPSFLKHLSPQKSPALSLAFNTLLGLVFLLPFPSWQKLVGFLVSALVIGYVVGPLSMTVLYRAIPEKFSFKSAAPCYALGFSAFYFCNLLIYWTGWDILYKVMIAFAVGYAFLFASRLRRSGRTVSLGFRRGWWSLPYLAGLGTISALGNFGGGTGALAQGWDALVVAIFTALIFALALRLGGSKSNIEEVLARVDVGADSARDVEF